MPLARLVCRALGAKAGSDGELSQSESEARPPSERASLVLARSCSQTVRYNTRDTPGILRTTNAMAKHAGTTIAETSAVLAMAVISIERSR